MVTVTKLTQSLEGANAPGGMGPSSCSMRAAANCQLVKKHTDAPLSGGAPVFLHQRALLPPTSALYVSVLEPPSRSRASQPLPSLLQVVNTDPAGNQKAHVMCKAQHFSVDPCRSLASGDPSVGSSCWGWGRGGFTQPTCAVRAAILPLSRLL